MAGCQVTPWSRLNWPLVMGKSEGVTLAERVGVVSLVGLEMGIAET